MRSVLIIAALLLGASQTAGAGELMDAEIDFLLDTVAASDCTFIRNGKEHSAADARDHLAMKRKRGRRYYDSTDQFIERIASSSSWSGKLYLIACAGEEARPIRGWYLERLDDFRARQAAAPSRP